MGAALKPMGQVPVLPETFDHLALVHLWAFAFLMLTMLATEEETPCFLPTLLVSYPIAFLVTPERSLDITGSEKRRSVKGGRPQSSP